MTKKLNRLIILIFLYPVIAEGADWVRTEINNFYVDVDSIKQVAPDQYKAWYKAELRNDDLIKEAKRYSFFDCSERKARALQTVKYFRDGSIEKTGEESLETVPPDSVMDDVLNFVCTYKKGTLKIPKKKGP